jgi:hypothetical protein
MRSFSPVIDDANANWAKSDDDEPPSVGSGRLVERQLKSGLSPARDKGPEIRVTTDDHGSPLGRRARLLKSIHSSVEAERARIRGKLDDLGARLNDEEEEVETQLRLTRSSDPDETPEMPSGSRTTGPTNADWLKGDDDELPLVSSVRTIEREPKSGFSPARDKGPKIRVTSDDPGSPLDTLAPALDRPLSSIYSSVQGRSC